MSDLQLPYRQIHLDFHTSDVLEGIGADFDPEVFAETLDQARVNSINLFARGHHGWVYYDSEKYADIMHPHLVRRNLLVEQIEACHKRGIKAPIYITVRWDHRLTMEHPEWLCMTADGKIATIPPFQPGFYNNLCLNSPYVDWLKEFVADVFARVPVVDGLWFDIVFPVDCACRFCRAEMQRKGLNPANAAQRAQFGSEVTDRFRTQMTEYVRTIDKDCLIFYNAGHVGPSLRRNAAAFTHMELESLPTGGWGYAHFPLSMRYARQFGQPCIGMTGKFHTTWGDFHSFKTQAALEYECFRMIALGAQCCVGDQLHPRGVLCPVTYDLIGRVYRQIEAREPWCVGARPVTEIAVLTPEAFRDDTARHTGDFSALTGALRMLTEGGHQFDIVDGSDDYSRYQVLILPDEIPVDAELAAKLKAHLAAGRAIIASFASGMDQGRTRFAFDAMPAVLAGEGPRDDEGQLVRGKHYHGNRFVEYLRPGPIVAGSLPVTDYVMYRRGMEIVAARGSEVLAETVPSYFDRTWDHFCSHNQAPSTGQPARPAVVRRGNLVYFVNPLFSQYQHNGSRWCKSFFLNVLAELLPVPLVRHNGPTSLEVDLTEQPDQGRCVLHLTHYVPVRTTATIDVIEDVLPLHDLELKVRTEVPVKAVLQPAGEPLTVSFADGVTTIAVPKLQGHAMVELRG